MREWTLLSELRIDLHRDEVRDYVRSQIPGGLRRAGISAEFTLASAVACQGRSGMPPEACLALFWTSLCFAGTENAACLQELLEARELPMPFRVIASQPHTAAVHAAQWLPGLDHAITLMHSGADVAEVLLPALAARRAWTHALVGEVWTPHEGQAEGDRFRAHWRALSRTAFQVPTSDKTI